ncbi:MAG TPA: glycosyltransferase family 2 protein [Anaerolineae bacterium]
MKNDQHAHQYPYHNPLVCVVVLNYNGRHHLEYCLPGIAATRYQPLQIIVVDNASTDGSTEYIRQNYSNVLLIESATNRGWSGGNNLGIVWALARGAKYIALVNNDVRVAANWVDIAVQLMEADPRTGIIGFQVFEPPHDVGFDQAVARWSEIETREVSPVSGLAMFVRASLFKQLGLIDEAFFAYAEDNDFERRVRKAGYRVVTTNVPIWHHGSGTFGRMPLRAAALQIRNNLRLSLKHDNPAGILYQFLRHLAKACLPFIRVDPNDRIARRLRPANVFVNLLIFLYACAWNLWHIRGTLRARREVNCRVQQVRRQLKSD